MMHFSKYVHLLEIEGYRFIYNIANGIAIALQPELFDLVNTFKCNPARLQLIHPELFDAFQTTEMVINDEIDEAERLIRRFEQLDNDPSKFGIIVNPTLDCNLRCWYCYETHQSGSMMKPAVIESVKKLIDDKVSDDRMTKLSLSFFGGEPLLGWSKVVIPLLDYAVKVCRNRSIYFSTGFTTNGVLLSDQKFNELSDLGLNNTSFQISFDGNRVLHDSSRVGISKQPTYDKIMRNVALGASKGFLMNLRFNYTPLTIDSFFDILTELEKLPEASKQQIICNFQQVWQTNSSGRDAHKKALLLQNAFIDSGIQTESDTLFHRQVCYADSPNNIVVNYNGDIYKCTAREFYPASREGVLTPDGKIEWNERFHARMAIKHINSACRECEIMPICDGGCSQKKLDRDNTTTCAYNRTKIDKRKFIIGSLYKNILKRTIDIDNI